MPDGAIKVSFGELEAASGNITGQAQKVQQELDNLKARLQPLVASWSGEAMETYQEHQRTWDTAAADLQQVLASIGTALGRATDDYRDGEATNRNRWA